MIAEMDSRRASKEQHRGWHT